MRRYDVFMNATYNIETKVPEKILLGDIVMDYRPNATLAVRYKNYNFTFSNGTLIEWKNGREYTKGDALFSEIYKTAAYRTLLADFERRLNTRSERQRLPENIEEILLTCAGKEITNAKVIEECVRVG